jgi:OTU domain-containing protein 6
MGKRDKIKKVLSPPSSYTPPQPTEDDQDLMDELFAQLDSKDAAVQKESEAVLEEIQLRQESERLETKQRQDAKSRFKARQVLSYQY